PVNAGKLAQALERAACLTRDQVAGLTAAALVPARRHLLISRRQGLELLPVADIRCFRADHKYVEALYPGGEALLSETLKELEDEFAGDFVRVHRNALVALAHVEAVEREADGSEHLRLNGIDWRPQVSRRQTAE